MNLSNRLKMAVAVGAVLAITSCDKKADLKSDKGQASYAIGHFLYRNTQSRSSSRSQAKRRTHWRASKNSNVAA